jgi:hypothetical protein
VTLLLALLSLLFRRPRPEPPTVSVPNPWYLGARRIVVVRCVPVANKGR